MAYSGIISGLLFGKRDDGGVDVEVLCELGAGSAHQPVCNEMSSTRSPVPDGGHASGIHFCGVIERLF
jgi:hypothetical protein